MLDIWRGLVGVFRQEGVEYGICRTFYLVFYLTCEKRVGRHFSFYKDCLITTIARMNNVCSFRDVYGLTHDGGICFYSTSGFSSG